ncbi:MAG: hypothetical protein LAO23_18565 [Acidobacteriia bacterium]|nr:hypothetical protein [Terriglobia bacterium]
MEIQDFAKEYQSKTDDELLRLELDSEQLTLEANDALKGELSRRQIGTDRLSAFREQESQRETEQAANPGRLFSIYSVGRRRFGKARYVYNSETGMERFTTTVFVILLYFPLIPTGTYLAERKRGFFSNPIIFLEELPLDWEQVLKVWVVAVGSTLALIWIFKLLPRLLYKP